MTRVLHSTSPCRNPILTGLAAIAVLVLLLPAEAAASGGSSSTPSIPTAQETPEQNAEQHYNRGLEHRDKAWELEKQAIAAEGAAAEKLLKKARKEYEKAVKSQRKAVIANPRMHQAHSSLGYALRKTGDFDGSIRAYDMALTLSPDYTEAIEYRAEAYLALNRLEEAKSAYLTLLRSDQARADELMTAMKKWLADRESGSSELSDEDLDAFAAWVEERADLAGRAAMILVETRRNW